MSFLGFDCDRCGACCESLIVEAAYYDAMREPKLYEIDGRIDREKLRTGEQCVILYDSKTNACPFLDGKTKDCGIYSTRPTCCVMVEAGDAKCQQARRMKGFPLLRDRIGNEPTIEMLEDSCEEYGLDIEDILASAATTEHTGEKP
jgi:Fe-S-cluster containining protein